MSANTASIHPSVTSAIGEQQTRIWRLRSLLDTLREAYIGGREPEDPEAALDALIEYADQIHLALETGPLVARAAELEQEKRRETDNEFRRRVEFGEEGGGTPPPVIQ